MVYPRRSTVLCTVLAPSFLVGWYSSCPNLTRLIFSLSEVSAVRAEMPLAREVPTCLMVLLSAVDDHPNSSLLPGGLCCM